MNLQSWSPTMVVHFAAAGQRIRIYVMWNCFVWSQSIGPGSPELSDQLHLRFFPFSWQLLLSTDNGGNWTDISYDTWCKASHSVSCLLPGAVAYLYWYWGFKNQADQDVPLTGLDNPTPSKSFCMLKACALLLSIKTWYQSKGKVSGRTQWNGTTKACGFKGVWRCPFVRSKAGFKWWTSLCWWWAHNVSGFCSRPLQRHSVLALTQRHTGNKGIVFRTQTFASDATSELQITRKVTS